MDPEAIGPYRILERLGAGGMGEVFLAFDTRLGRKVALKSLSNPSLDAPSARGRLLREARAAAHITHPNIAAIYDILETSDHPCIVMEYAEGEPLSSLVSRGPVPCADVLPIARQIVDAVGHAHSAGVIHRDLKPANIVLTPEHVVKVLDFGLARTHEPEGPVNPDGEVTQDLTASRVGNIAGTPAYMAPELLIGYPASASTDVYAIGATLFELLAGRKPFGGSTPSAIAWEIVSKPTPCLSDTVPSVPGPLAAVVAKAMAKHPADRYQSAAEMAAALEAAAQDCGPESRPVAGRVQEPSSATPSQAFAVSSRVAILAVGLAVMALFVTVFVAVRLKEAPPTASAQFVAVLPFASESGDDAAALEAGGFAAAVVATLEGLSSVTVLSQPAAGSLPATGDARKNVLAAGVTSILTGAVGGPPGHRTLAIRVEDAAGKVVFSRTYDQRAAAAAATPSTAIRDIVTGLRVPLTSADELRLDNAPACRPDTYIEIARGRTFLAREDVEGNPARAESVFRAAASRDPSCAQAYAGLADASWARYGVEHRAELSVAASAASTTAKTLDPESPTIRMALARVYLNTGRAPQAEQLIREVIDRRPADDEPHRLLSSILDAQKRGEEAEAELHRAITLRPASAINHLALGNRQFRTLHYREALASYQKVLDVQPDNEWATGNCFAAHIMLGNFQQAIDVYQAARVKDATMQSNLGSIYVWLNRCDEAVAILRGAVDDAPRDDVKRRNLGDAYACLGRRAEALREYQVALSITRDLLAVNSENARDLARHAVYEAKCGSLALAAEHAEEAVRRSPSDGEVLYRAAVVHALSKQPARAVERLRQAIDKGYPPALARADPDLRAIERVAGVSEMLGGK